MRSGVLTTGGPLLRCVFATMCRCGSFPLSPAKRHPRTLSRRNQPLSLFHDVPTTG